MAKKKNASTPQAPYRPVSRGRASIAHTDLRVRFRTKEQAAGLINLMLQDEISWTFSYEVTVETEHGREVEFHNISVEDISWGNNLARFGAWVRDVDYRD